MKKKLGKRKGGDDSDGVVKKAQKRKKSLIEKIEGPSAADKLLPRTLEERMNARRIVVILEKCPLELVAPRKGAYELLNSDDHKGICAKTQRDLADVRPGASGDTLLRLTDDAALSVAKANQLGCWPLLVQRLGEIVQSQGSRWESKSLEVRDNDEVLETEVPGVLLGQLKPLLIRHWDSGFEERGLGFFNEVGQFVNLRKMKHFIAELLKWRCKRQELVRSQAVKASAVDQALETRLILATSTRHNDMVLCCSYCSGSGLKGSMSSPMASAPAASPSKTQASSFSSSSVVAEGNSPEDASSPQAPSGSKSLEKESQRLRIENAELKKRLQFGSEFLKQENRRLRVENAELKKRLYFAGPYAQGASTTSVPIWFPVPVMASGCSGCGATPAGVQQATAEQVSPHSVTPGSVTPIPPRSFWVPLPSNVMSPSGQPWPQGQLVAVQISGPAQTPPSTYSETSQQENFLPRNILSDPTTASQVSSSASPDHDSGFAVPFQTDDRWVCIPSGIVERHKAQFETPASGDDHEHGGNAQVQAGQHAVCEEGRR